MTARASAATHRIPFVETLGVDVVMAEGGRSRLELPLREALCNSLGVAHGGVLMTLLDVAMAQAARSPHQPGHDTSPRVVTIEMKTSFLRPGTGRLVAEGRVLHRTASLAFCEATVHGDDGRPAAHATGTFKYLRSDNVHRRRLLPTAEPAGEGTPPDAVDEPGRQAAAGATASDRQERLADGSADGPPSPTP